MQLHSSPVPQRKARIEIIPLIDVMFFLLASFMMDGKPPRSVAVIDVETIFFQCARAILRADLWNPAKHVDPASLPTPGQILAGLTENRVGGEPYDKEWPERARKSMW